MSLYAAGLVVAPREQVGASPPAKKATTGQTLAIIGGLGALIFIGIPAFRRARMPRAESRGPDVSDIEARYHARGIDPRTVF